MRPFCAKALIGGVVCLGSVAAIALAQTVENDPAVTAADRTFVEALAKTDKPAVRGRLDAKVMWTTAAGETLEWPDLMESLPMPPLGHEAGAQVIERTYGDMGAVQVSSGKVHILRVWVKRPEGWRLIDYHIVTQRDTPAPRPAATTNDCENPCRSVPYTPRNAAEKAILTAWGQLETAVTNHEPEAWSPHFLDEFVLVASRGTRPVTKQGRVAQLSQPGIGPAPAQLAADPPARFYHFGDAVLMVAQSKPYAGKPARISRIWVKHAGAWRMALSYQTTLQAAPEIVPPVN